MPLKKAPCWHKNGRKPYWLLFLTLLLLCMCSCARKNVVTVNKDVPPALASRQLPEDQLLNVAIKVFDPGSLPEDKDERMGLSEEIRQAEAVFYAVHLKDTLQHSGFWGSVWVVPQGQVMEDLVVSGRIEYSDGEKLVLYIHAEDATGRTWIDRTYEETSTKQEREKAKIEKQDAFQDLFNAISNDLVKFRNSLNSQQLVAIHNTSEMRFAASMAKEPFSHYLLKDSKGRYHLAAFPAENDQMLKRVRLIRARDEMLMDVLTSYYDGYYTRLWSPYHNWRKFRSEELETIREIKNRALATQVMGFAAIVGSVLLGTVGGDDTYRAVAPIREILAAGGVAAIYSGHQMRKDAKMNEEAIKELGESLSSDARPLLVQIKGDTLRLTGTAKEQYAKWRRLLSDIYSQESEPNRELPEIIGPETEPLPERITEAVSNSKNQDKKTANTSR